MSLSQGWKRDLQHQEWDHDIREWDGEREECHLQTTKGDVGVLHVPKCDTSPFQPRSGDIHGQEPPHHLLAWVMIMMVMPKRPLAQKPLVPKCYLRTSTSCPQMSHKSSKTPFREQLWAGAP